MRVYFTSSKIAKAIDFNITITAENLLAKPIIVKSVEKFAVLQPWLQYDDCLFGLATSRGFEPCVFVYSFYDYYQLFCILLKSFSTGFFQFCVILRALSTEERFYAFLI